MKQSAKMLMLMANGNSRDTRENRSVNHEYDPEDRFRDRRGREHYDNGRYAPRSEMMEPESREHDRYSDGRFGPRNEMEERYYAPSSGYGYPYVPPIYRGGQEMYSNQGEGLKPMNKIGFAVSGEGDIKTPREFNHNFESDEMAYRGGGERMSGYGSGSGYMPFTKEMADSWTKGMQNEDGSTGPHWTLDQTKQVQAQKGIECDPMEFYAAINMVYSDYGKVAKKLGVNTIDFYADMAKAFLHDKDAPEDKLARYYEYIARG